MSLPSPLRAAGSRCLLLSVACLVGLAACRDGSSKAGTPVAEYVGRDACAPCHEAATRAWTGSRHDRAMQPADSTTVLGDFDGGTHTYSTGVTSSFFRRDGGYWVRTDGPDGRPTEYPIAYTFGVYPLQQYLIAFPGGRYQALNVVWDTRPRPEGGQRWYHLYPDERVDFRDVLHWTGPLQNWNYMCADCHSTGVRKNYDPDSNAYRTSWTDIDVSCEACHGPGSAHVAWAAPENESRRDRDPARGLAVALPAVPGGTWVFDAGQAIARRAVPRQTDSEIESCGRCHVRASVTWDPYRHGEPLAQTRRIALLDDLLYEADGQQRDEVYEYGSFLQSRMARAGVTCSDCHDPHQGGQRAPGNAICAKCHLATRYDAAEHHRHAPGSAGAECVACHMPVRTYMGVDQRRDHGFRIPRPDLTILVRTPNACTDCHQDRPAAWAANAVERWFGPRDSLAARYAVAVTAGREGWPGAGDALLTVARDTATSAIQRATALSLLPRNPTGGALAAIQLGLGDPDHLVRRAAVEAVRDVSPSMRLRMAGPLLNDPVRAVRLAVVPVLASVPADQWPADQRARFDSAVVEYRASQEINGDRAESHANLGNLAMTLGQYAEAEREFRQAIALWPKFAMAWAQLAELYRGLGREVPSDSVLRGGLAVNPEAADLHHALGLSLVRQRQTVAAVPEFAEAARLGPEVARYAFVYGVAVHDTGDPARGLAILREALERHPWNRDLLQGVVSFAAELGRRDEAREAARKLVQLSPGDQELLRQWQSLSRP